MRGRGLSWWAAIGHRLSGIALAVFLPLHFLALGLALEGAATLDGFLRFADLPLVKVAELGLVVFLSVHLLFGLRVLLLELGRWRGLRPRLVYAGALATVAAGVAFIVSVA